MNRRLGAMVWITVLLTHLGQAQSGDLSTLPAQMQCLTDQGRIPGAVTLVSRDSRLVHHSVVGFQDIGRRVPLTRQSVFRLYSMSKPITSVAILMLAEQGRLSLDDPAQRFIPEFHDMRVYVSGTVDDMVTAPVDRPIRIRDLLTHTSGITYHFTGDTPVHQYYRKYGVKRDTPVGSRPTDAPAARSLEELVRRLGKAPLLHQPGQVFDYSYSTTVLGYIVEKASGQRLDRFLENRIFAPLGMTHTGFFVRGPALDRFVTNYQWSDGHLQMIENTTHTDYRDPDRLLDGGGALAGTADDYLRFARMLANDGALDGRRLLKPASVDLMLRDELPATAGGRGPMPGVPFEFGYGVQIGNTATAQAGTLPAGAAGWDGSANTFFWVDRARHQATVFMTQVITPQGSPAPLKQIVYQAVYGTGAPTIDVCH